MQLFGTEKTGAKKVSPEARNLKIVQAYNMLVGTSGKIRMQEICWLCRETTPFSLLIISNATSVPDVLHANQTMRIPITSTSSTCSRSPLQ